jgi:sigma-B regulation protein RsbU (phosphoserine phosphatase)
MSEAGQDYVRRAQRFVEEYTQGLNVRDLRRLFDQDASHAYKVLARDQEGEELPEERLKRLFYRLRIVFLGLSYKLTPARRALFVVSLLLVLAGLFTGPAVNLEGGRFHLYLEFSALWFVGGAVGLVWLLALELVDRVRVRDELEVARQLQSDLLPKRSPDLPGYDFAHSYRTANEVGGDYYDFLHLPDGRLAILMGDASGHGIAAGLLMAIANATLKTAIDVDPEPLPVATLLNSALYRTGDRRAFMTLFYGVLEPASGRLDFLIAGHPFPIVRRAGGTVEELGSGGLPLGLRRKADLQPLSVTLAPDDVLLLYTDGLPEAVDGPDGEAFGFDRLRRLLATAGSPAVLHDRILIDFDRHVANEPLADDLTLVVLARLAR